MAGTARELVELAIKVSECRMMARLYGEDMAAFSLEDVAEGLMSAALAMEEAEGEEEPGG